MVAYLANEVTGRIMSSVGKRETKGKGKGEKNDKADVLGLNFLYQQIRWKNSYLDRLVALREGTTAQFTGQMPLDLHHSPFVFLTGQ